MSFSILNSKNTPGVAVRAGRVHLIGKMYSLYAEVELITYQMKHPRTPTNEIRYIVQL